MDVFSGCVHSRADKFLSSFGEGTQRTYAYHLVDHLRWLAANGYREDSITIRDLLRYLALCGSQHYGPLGTPWRATPLGESAQAVRATCLKAYYVDLTTRENVNGELRAALSIRRLPNSKDRDRSALGQPRYVASREPAFSRSCAEEVSSHTAGRDPSGNARCRPNSSRPDDRDVVERLGNADW